MSQRDEGCRINHSLLVGSDLGFDGSSDGGSEVGSDVYSDHGSDIGGGITTSRNIFRNGQTMIKS